MVLAAQETPTVINALMLRWATAKQNVIEAAKAMPASEYNFRLTPQQRTFGEWVSHTAMLFENSCSLMVGRSVPPMDHSKHASADKAALVQMLESSAQVCDESLRGLDDIKLLLPAGQSRVIPVNHALNVLMNASSHYGNMVGYLRMKGITPPSTARNAAPAKKP